MRRFETDDTRDSGCTTIIELVLIQNNVKKVEIRISTITYQRALI